MLPSYSVLMSLYIKEKPEYLIKSIQSMINQTVKPDEIVIVKDGPITEELNSVLLHFTSEHPALFRIVNLEQNVGLGLALNKGLEVCRNNLVARMDTDDISYPTRCELQLNEFVKKPELDIIGTLTSEFSDSLDKVLTVRMVPENHEEIVKFSRRRSPFNHPTVMYKKSSVISVGGYRDVLRKEDIDLFARMLNNGANSKNLQERLLYFRSNEDNYKRRKSWVNIMNYIKVIFGFWKEGYSSFTDLIFVTISQIAMFLVPTWLLRIVSERVLRKKI